MQFIGSLGHHFTPECERLAQPRVPLLVVLVEVQSEAEALQRLVVAAGQLRK
jgi:hypothetical protein